MAVVQAPEVDADTFAGLPNVLPGERAVYIKPDVIVRAESVKLNETSGCLRGLW
jgi:hypothetical protein